MHSASWLFLSLPVWFFQTLAHPFSAGALSFVPFIGCLCLFAGVMLGILKRDARLTLFLISPALSEALAAIAGLMRGKLADPSILLVLFLGLQGLGMGYLVFRLRDVRLPAILLAVFGFAFALEAAFIAAMSFSDTWI